MPRRGHPDMTTGRGELAATERRRLAASVHSLMAAHSFATLDPLIVLVLLGVTVSRSRRSCGLAGRRRDQLHHLSRRVAPGVS
jgi:hypothetical protein